jgi:hypothetical protein
MDDMSDTTSECMSCYGTGEVVTEQGGMACPDCYGAGRSLGRNANTEWRLRELERRYDDGTSEVGADVQWLLHEVRRCRETLVRILTICQDADEGDRLAYDVKYQANEALGIYDPQID